MNKSAEKNSSKSMSRSAPKSKVASRFFLGYECAEKRFFDSFFYRSFSFISKKFSYVKGLISSSFEKSAVSSASDSLIVKLFEKNLRYYGVSLFFFSIFLIAFSSIRDISTYGNFNLFSSDRTSPAIFAGISLFISVLMMSSQKCLAELFCESRLFSYILFRVFCFDILKTQKIQPVQRSHTFPVIIGILFAFVCALVSPMAVLGIILFITLAVIIFRIPENGVIFIFLALPFLSESMLLTSVVLVCASYVFKLLRNKRVYKIGLFDVSVFIFSFIVLLYGFFSVKNVGSLKFSFIILLFVLFGFVISNTMKTGRLIEKCISALIASTSVIAFIGILDYIFIHIDLFSDNLFLKGIIATLNQVPFAAKEVYGELITLIIPLTLIEIKLSEKASDKTKALISLAVMVMFSVLTFNISVWFSAVFSIIVFIFFLKPKFGFVIACASVAIFAFYALFPMPFETAKSFVFKFADASGGAYVSPNFYEILSRFKYLGAGSGSEVLKYISGCMFGFGMDEIYTLPNSFMSFLLQYGIIGVLSFASMFIILIMHCVGFCYSDIKYNPRMKLFAVACAVCVTSIIIKAFFFNVLLSVQSLLCIIMISFISVASKRSAVIEFVPDKADFTMFDENSAR